MTNIEHFIERYDYLCRSIDKINVDIKNLKSEYKNKGIDTSKIAKYCDHYLKNKNLNDVDSQKYNKNILKSFISKYVYMADYVNALSDDIKSLINDAKSNGVQTTLIIRNYKQISKDLMIKKRFNISDKVKYTTNLQVKTENVKEFTIKDLLSKVLN